MRTWVGGSTAVNQVTTIEVTATGGTTDTWTLTLTDTQTGETQTETYQNDGSPTITEIVAGLVAAWNNSTQKLFKQVTAADADPNITLTADTAGVPFDIALTNDGTGTSSETATQPNVGPTDYACVDNWLELDVPDAADDVVISGTFSILYNLDQSGVAIDGFTVRNYSGSIGLDGAYLQIDPNSFSFESSATAYIDISSANIDVEVVSTASASGNDYGLYLLGSDMNNIYVRAGSLGIALNDGETATFVDIETTGSARAEVGQGCTATDVRALDASDVVTNVNITEIDAQGTATVETRGVGATCTTMTAREDAVITANATGTVTNGNAYGGTIDTLKSAVARTFSNVNRRAGGVFKYDAEFVTVSALSNDGPTQIQDAA